jgi:hypothetical protein
MTRQTLKKDWATFARGDFRIENNVWNQGDLVNGRDYTQTISYDPKHLTSELKFAWDWPKTDHLLAFPEIEAGYKPWSETGSAALTTRISKMQAMDVSFNYDIGGDTSRFNVGFDMWLTSKPDGNSNSITTEISIWTHRGDIDPEGEKVGTYRDGEFQGQIWVDDNFGHAGDGQTWRYVTIRSKGDVLNGTLDVDHLFDTLLARKLVNDSDYFNGYEFGAQLTGGKGSLTIHSLAHAFSALDAHSATGAHAPVADHFVF